jgi:uncharacterized protein YjbI with pentapeptide repeats
MFSTPIRTLTSILLITLIFLVAISLNWNWISSHIFPNTSIGLYNRDFWVNTIVSLHGVVIELGVFGVLVLWLDTKREHKQAINRQLEDLVDFATLDIPEINMKKVGHIKRLNSSNFKTISVSNLTIPKMIISDIELHKSKLIGFKIPHGQIKETKFVESKMRSSNFENATLKNTIFENCNLYKTNFNSILARGINFTGSCLERSSFISSDLKNSNFKNCDLREVIFDDSILDNCNFMQCTNLDTDAIAKAKSLNYIKIDPTKLDELKKLRTDMRYQGSGRP